MHFFDEAEEPLPTLDSPARRRRRRCIKRDELTRSRFATHPPNALTCRTFSACSSSEGKTTLSCREKVTGAPFALSEIEAASKIRTSSRPSRPPLKGRLPVLTQPIKC